MEEKKTGSGSGIQKNFEEDEIALILETIKTALEEVDEFRLQEGKALEKDVLARAEKIRQLLGEIKPHEKGRISRVRERMEKNLRRYVDILGWVVVALVVVVIIYTQLK